MHEALMAAIPVLKEAARREREESLPRHLHDSEPRILADVKDEWGQYSFPANRAFWLMQEAIKEGE